MALPRSCCLDLRALPPAKWHESGLNGEGSLYLCAPSLGLGVLSLLRATKRVLGGAAYPRSLDTICSPYLRKQKCHGFLLTRMPEKLISWVGVETEA